MSNAEPQHDPTLDNPAAAWRAIVLCAYERKGFWVAGVHYEAVDPPRADDGTELVFVNPLEKAVIEALRHDLGIASDAWTVRDWIRATLMLLEKPTGADLLIEVAKQVGADR